MTFTTQLAAHPACGSVLLDAVARQDRSRTVQLLVLAHPSTAVATRRQILAGMGLPAADPTDPTTALGAVRPSANEWVQLSHLSPAHTGAMASLALELSYSWGGEKTRGRDAILTNPYTPVSAAATAAHLLVTYGPMHLDVNGHVATWVDAHPEHRPALAARAACWDVPNILQALTDPYPPQTPTATIVRTLNGATTAAQLSHALARARPRIEDVLTCTGVPVALDALLATAKATFLPARARSLALRQWVSSARTSSAFVRALTAVILELAADEHCDPDLARAVRDSVGGPWNPTLAASPHLSRDSFADMLAQAGRGTVLPEVMTTIACHPLASPGQRQHAREYLAGVPLWQGAAHAGASLPNLSETGQHLPRPAMRVLGGPLWDNLVSVALADLAPTIATAGAAQALVSLDATFTGTLREIFITACAIGG